MEGLGLRGTGGDEFPFEIQITSRKLYLCIQTDYHVRNMSMFCKFLKSEEP